MKYNIDACIHMLGKTNNIRNHIHNTLEGEMGRLVEKRGCLGCRKIVFFEEEEEPGDYSFINGDWIWSRSMV